MGAWLRGSIRERFNIQGQRSTDCTAWLCCCCFAAAQEAKHSDDVCNASWCQEEVQRQQEARREELEQKEKEQKDATHKAKAAEQSAAVKAALEAARAERIGKPEGSLSSYKSEDARIARAKPFSKAKAFARGKSVARSLAARRPSIIEGTLEGELDR